MGIPERSGYVPEKLRGQQTCSGYVPENVPENDARTAKHADAGPHSVQTALPVSYRVRTPVLYRLGSVQKG